MRKLAGVLLALCLALPPFPTAYAMSVSNAVVNAAPLTSASTTLDGMVRVYLLSLGSPSALTLTVAGSYSLSTGTSLTNGETLSIGFSSSSGAITLTRNGTKTNMGTTFSIRRHSATGTNGIKISQARKPANPYPGDVTFRAVYQSGGYYKLYTIVNIYIEDYLYGVLPYEMGSSAPSEALKAQAVAARTYTVRMMNSRASGVYDVVDTTGDQMYNGTPSGYKSCVSAVDATKGIVLKNNGSYTATYYSASNGGQTESIRNIWGSTGYSYLNVHDDPFDYNNPNSVVKKTTVYADCSSSYNNPSLMALLKTKAVTALAAKGYASTSANTMLSAVKSIVAHTPMYSSPSRLYTKMDFTLTVSTVNASGSAVTVSVTVTCDIFSELESLLRMSIQSGKNELWSVTQSGSTYTLAARRYGHGLGLSQRGAMYMGKLGYTYDAILGFYYPGSTRVGTTFTSTVLAAGSSEEVTTEEEATEIEGGDEDACTAVVKLVSNSGTLAIRASKSTSGTLLGVMPNSSPMTVLAGDGTWCLIKFGAIVGYVPANALTITGTVPESSDASVTSIHGFATVTASGYLNLRASGSYSASVLSTAPSGAVLTVFSQTSSWAYIQYGSTAAYACADYLSFSDTYPGKVTSTGTATATVDTEDGNGTALRATAGTSATVLAQLPEGASVTVMNNDGSWAYVTYNGTSGYVLSSDLAADAETTDPTGTGGDGSGDTGEGDKGEGESGKNEKATVATESGSLNMRQEGRAGSTILTTIPKGATVTVTFRGDTWCAVTYNGYAGYVMTVFLQFSGESGSGDETVDTTATVTTASGSLNLRQLPKTGSTILTTIPRLATVQVYTRGTEWCNVTYAGINGYVMTVFLTFTQDRDATATPSVSPTVTPTETPASQETEATATPTATVTESPTPTPTPTAAVLTAVVTTASGSLNLRAGMESGASILTRIPRGTTITILEQYTAWSQTTYGGYTGYVMNSYLTFSTDGGTTETTDTTATVTTAYGSLNLRASPGGTVLTSIPQYASVQVLQYGNTWCYLQYAGFYGYAMTAYLTLSESVETTPTVTPTVTPTASAETEPTATTETTATATPETTATVTPEVTPTPTPEAETITATVTTSYGSLNLRASANTSAEILTTIPRLGTVTVLEKGVVWCRVEYGAYGGYVQTTYLTFAQGDTGTQTEETATGTGTSVTAWVYTASGSLNLRASASTSAKLLTAIPRLAEVTLLSQGDTWSLLTYNGWTGYAMTTYLTTVKPAELGGSETTTATATPMPEAGTTATATATPMPEPTAEDTEKTTVDYTETAAVEEALLTAPDTDQYALVTPEDGESAQSLWKSCTEQTGWLLEMIRNSQVQVLRLGDTWCEVLYFTQKGFCRTEGLTMID